MAGLILALDCALDRLTVLLADEGGEPVAEIERGPGAWRGETVVEELRALRARAGFDWRDLEALAVCVGPGSFTGVRTAVAVARGLALAAGLPVHPVSTLEGLAAAAGGDDRRPLVAVMRGRRGEFHFQPFDPGAAATAPPASLPAQELALRLDPGIRVVGFALDELRRVTSPGIAWIELRPEARTVLAAVRARRARGEAPQPGFAVRPLYLRAPDANPLAGRPLVAAMA